LKSPLCYCAAAPVCRSVLQLAAYLPLCPLHCSRLTQSARSSAFWDVMIPSSGSKVKQAGNRKQTNQ
jgi:hypothetical protein